MHIIKEELLLSNAQVSLIFSTPLIILAATAIPSGTLADQLGIRKTAGIGAIIIVLGSLLRGTSSHFATLLTFTCLYGVGMGLVYPVLPKLVGTWFPPEKIGLATGTYATGIVLSGAITMAITLPAVFPITNTFQGVFYIWTIPALAAAVMWWIVTKEPHPLNEQNKQVGEDNKPSYRIWTNGTLWLVAIVLFFHTFAFFTWTGWLSQLLMTKGVSPALSTLITSAIVWAGLPLVFIAPWASDKIGLRKPFLWVTFIILVLAPFAAVYGSLSLSWFIAIVVGIAVQIQFPIILSLSPEIVPAEGVGRASGMVLSIGYIGGLVGPWITGYIVDITGTFKLAFILLALMAAVATFFALRLPETGSKAKLKKRYSSK